MDATPEHPPAGASTASDAGAAPRKIVRLVAVAAGGAIGASLRWGLDVAMGVEGWPAATLVANLLGTVVLAVLVRRLGTSTLAVGLTVGVLGAFTTFSALAVQAVGLADRPVVAMGYVLASLVGGVVAAAAGLRLGGAR